MADLTALAAHIQALVGMPRARAWRSKPDGSVEHRCARCGVWQPATTDVFRPRLQHGRWTLHAYCRPCAAQPAPAEAGTLVVEAVQPPAQQPAARPAAVLESERTCRCCHVTLPLGPECWPRTARGYSPVCLDCTSSLRSRAAALMRREVCHAG